MEIQLIHTLEGSDKNTLFVVFISEDEPQLQYPLIKEILGLEPDEIKVYAKKGSKHLFIWQGRLVISLGLGKNPSVEHIRKATFQGVSLANEYQSEHLTIIPGSYTSEIPAIAESALLSNYQFLNYKSEPRKNNLLSLKIITEGSRSQELERSEITARATCIARDLVNEPVIALTAVELSRRLENLGNKFGFEVEVLNKPKIQALKMGGLLAVNMGSTEPPTFNILTYRPEKAKNKRPVILVGKGVVYDTGGLSLKSTANSMDFMKSDMAGAAAVVGAICGLADLNSQVYVIGLIPATDNRPGQNAFAPGDVIKMYDGTSVEVLNTDAEGRMILADALAYAKKYDPVFVIDLATLTGASVVAIGQKGLVMMSTAGEKLNKAFKKSGEEVYERLVEFPLWEEYGDSLQSDIADLKNLGTGGAGAITAAKFLEHFTDYPWIHLDIAGASYLQQKDSYRGKHGTGTGVRLLIHFIENLRHYEQSE